MILKIKNVNGLIIFLQIILIFICLIFLPPKSDAAELLQINDPNTILVGDQNRSLYLSLYCVDINENNKDKATDILKKNFPRGTKVKIKPYGLIDNKLLAKVYRIDNETEMTDLLNSINSLNKNCIN